MFAELDQIREWINRAAHALTLVIENGYTGENSQHEIELHDKIADLLGAVGVIPDESEM